MSYVIFPNDCPDWEAAVETAGDQALFVTCHDHACDWGFVVAESCDRFALCVTEQVDLLVVTASHQVSPILQINNRRHSCSMTRHFGLHTPILGIPQNERWASMITARGQKSIIIERPNHGKTTNRRIMATQSGDFLPIDWVNVDSFVFGPSGDVPVVDKEDAQDGFTVVGDNALAMVEIDCLTVLNNWALLVWRDELELGFQVFFTHWRHVFGLAHNLNIFLAKTLVDNRDIGVIVGVMRVKHIFLVGEIGVIHLP